MYKYYNTLFNDLLKKDSLSAFAIETFSFWQLKYCESSLERTSLTADTSLQRTLFSGTDEMTLKLL